MVYEHKGSTFTITSDIEPNALELVRSNVIGRDDYSVFDAKSHMKDQIIGKSKAIAAQSYAADYIAKRVGVPTTMIGYTAPNIMHWWLARFDESLKPTVNDTCYVPDGEFIIRNILNDDSSVLKKLNTGEITLGMIDWPELPPVNAWLENPVSNITHKFLPGDPYHDLSNGWRKFTEYTGMTRDDFSTGWFYQLKANKALIDYLSMFGAKMPDNKNEFIIGPKVSGFTVKSLSVLLGLEPKFCEPIINNGGRLKALSDVLFNQDNTRVLVKIGDKMIPWSKQFYRDFKMYVQFNEWYEPFMTAKSVDKLPFEEWPDDPGNPAYLNKFGSDFYASFTNLFTGPVLDELFNSKEVFPGAPSIEDVYAAKLPIQAEIDEARKQCKEDMDKLNARIKAANKKD